MRFIGTEQLPLAISAAEFRDRTHLREGQVVDDAALEPLLRQAQEIVTAVTGHPLQGAWEFTTPVGYWERWFFPCRPIVSLTSLAVNDQAGGWVDVATAGWRLARPNDEPSLVKPLGWLPDDETAEDLRIQVVAGGALSAAAERAVVRLAKEWLDADTAIEGDQMAPRMTMGAGRLIKHAKYIRPAEFR